MTKTFPETLILKPELLFHNCEKYLSGLKPYLNALKLTTTQAEESLARPFFSVVEKSAIPPSGDVHDYMSLGTYWWPDRGKKDGLPYIVKDGQQNPETKTIKDQHYLKLISRDVLLLGVCWFFTRDEKYAEKARIMLNHFFLDDSNRMNPNLNHGQVIRGVSNGRGIGLIDTECLTEMLDGVQLLKDSNSWKNFDHRGLIAWFQKYLHWMLESRIGIEGSTSKNNIGTYYELQVVVYGMFIGDKDLAKQRLVKEILPRIPEQFEPDGSQPRELSRTMSWIYSHKNLKGWFRLASVAERLEIDLWNYETADGRGIKKAFSWMLSFATGEQDWKHREIRGLEFDRLIPLARTASVKYPELDLWSYLSSHHEDFANGKSMELLSQEYAYLDQRLLQPLERQTH